MSVFFSNSHKNPNHCPHTTLTPCPSIPGPLSLDPKHPCKPFTFSRLLHSIIIAKTPSPTGPHPGSLTPHPLPQTNWQSIEYIWWSLFHEQDHIVFNQIPFDKNTSHASEVVLFQTEEIVQFYYMYFCPVLNYKILCAIFNNHDTFLSFLFCSEFESIQKITTNTTYFLI